MCATKRMPARIWADDYIFVYFSADSGRYWLSIKLPDEILCGCGLSETDPPGDDALCLFLEQY